MRTIFILLFLAIGHLSFCQNLTIEVANGSVYVHDDGDISPVDAVDTVAWEYVFHGDCWNWKSGKFAPSHDNSFELLSEMEDGFLVQKIWWYGMNKPDGSIKWQSQTSTCFSRPDFPVDTVQVGSPVTINIPANVYQVVWSSLEIHNNFVTFHHNSECPDGAVVVESVVTNMNGQLASGYLWPGSYAYVLVFKWKQFHFLQSGNFSVF